MFRKAEESLKIINPIKIANHGGIVFERALSTNASARPCEKAHTIDPSSVIDLTKRIEVREQGFFCVNQKIWKVDEESEPKIGDIRIVVDPYGNASCQVFRDAAVRQGRFNAVMPVWKDIKQEPGIKSKKEDVIPPQESHFSFFQSSTGGAGKKSDLADLNLSLGKCAFSVKSGSPLEPRTAQRNDDIFEDLRMPFKKMNQAGSLSLGTVASCLKAGQPRGHRTV